MPAYINSPFQKPILIMKGVASYLIGSFDYKIGDTYAAVTNVALTSNVATVTVQIITGPLPLVGQYISIINTTSTSGLFNVSRAIITGVTINTTTNAGTITFALTHADVATAAQTGSVIVEPAEVGESVSTTYTSQACVIQAPEGDSQFTVPFSVYSGATNTAMTATLQKALKVQPSEWTNTTSVVTKTGATTYSAGPVVEATLERAYLYRIAITAVTGTDLVVGKIGG